MSKMTTCDKRTPDTPEWAVVCTCPTKPPAKPPVNWERAVKLLVWLLTL